MTEQSDTARTGVTDSGSAVINEFFRHFRRDHRPGRSAPHRHPPDSTTGRRARQADARSREGPFVSDTTDLMGVTADNTVGDAPPASGGGTPTAAATDAPAAPAAGAATGTASRRRRSGTGLEGMVLAELQQVASGLGIKGTARMRKSQLIAAIQEKQGGAGQGSAGGEQGVAATVRSDAKVERPRRTRTAAAKRETEDQVTLIEAALTTVICFAVGYPAAYFIATRPNARVRNTLLVLVILPFWTSFLIRVYAWIGLLKIGQPKPKEDGYFLVPIFFASVGAAVDLRTLNPFIPGNFGTFGLGIALLVVAVVTKYAAGFIVRGKSVDRRVVGELHEFDHPLRLRPDLVEVFLREHCVTRLVELVALHDLRVRHFAVAVRAPALLLNARLALGVELVEGNGAARFGRREHLDRDVHQADLEVALPRCSCSHTVVSSRESGVEC